MSRLFKSFVFALVALLLMATNVACGGGPASPTSLPSVSSVSPTVKATVATIAPPSSFTFVQVKDGDEPIADLPLWALRGENTVEGARMMSFCDTGVTSGQAENFGLIPARIIAGPMTLVIGPGFSDEEKSDIVSVAAEREWPVPLTVQEGAVDGVPPDGFIYVSRDLNLKSGGGAYPVTKNSVAVAGGVIIGPWKLTPSLMRHELGHLVMGLCHHNLPGAMSGITKDGQFSKAELDNVNMARRLAPGTCYPGTPDRPGARCTNNTLDARSFIVIYEEERRE